MAKGVKAVKVVYADGGQNPVFADSVSLLSRPDALAKGPVEIHINENGKPVPAVVQVASAKTAPVKTVAPAARKPAAAQTTIAQTPSAPAAAPGANASAFAATPAPAADQPFYKRWLGVGGKEAAPEPAAAPAAPPTAQPAAVPLPPRRQAQNPAIKPQASLTAPRLPNLVTGATPVLPAGLSAYAPVQP